MGKCHVTIVWCEEINNLLDELDILVGLFGRNSNIMVRHNKIISNNVNIFLSVNENKFVKYLHY